MLDLRGTITPKSDQLNADDLVSGEMRIKVTKVVMKESSDQPISIHYENDNGKPYKPCLTMRRALVQLWGYDGEQYVGRYIQLYLDKSVKWAGVEVGGIRIKAVSHIEQSTQVLLTVAKGKRRPVTIGKIEMKKPSKTLTPERFSKALEALKQSKTTVEEIEGYDLTEEQIQELETIKNL